MSEGALSFELRNERPDKIVQTAVSRAARVSAPGLGVLFVSGGVAQELPDIARAIARRAPEQTWLVAGTLGVLTERGELERQSAAAGLVTGGVRGRGVMMETRASAFGEQLGKVLREMPASTALTLIRADRFEEDALASLSAQLGGSRRSGSVFGGGTLPGQDVFVIEQGRVSQGAAAALVVSGLGPARVAASPACRLLSPLLRVTEVRGSMLLGLEGQRALDALGASAQSLEDQPLILVAVAATASSPAAESEKPPLLLRAIQGVDPARGGILVGEGVEVGARVAFAIRDGHAARSDFEGHLRRLAQSTAGAAPRFGIYVNCVGRGESLYGASDVDVKLVRSRFSQMPLVGLHSAFEIAPFGSTVALQLYTGVLALFTAPS
jgi:small ligand-binding sensory domain FIST